MSIGLLPTVAVIPVELAAPVVGSRAKTLTVLLAELVTNKFI
jgi:hypothetical protein